MKKLLKCFSKVVPDLIMILGAAAIAAGVGMLNLPAGIIAGGALAIAGSVLLTLGGDGR